MSNFVDLDRGDASVVLPSTLNLASGKSPNTPQEGQSSPGNLRRQFPGIARLVLLFLTGWVGICCNLFADAQDEYSVAVALYRQSKWKQAADQFRKFIAAHEKHEKAGLARLYLGLALVSLEDFKQAHDELTRFAAENKQNPNLAQARYRIGECSYLLDDLPAAKAELETYVSEFPNDQMGQHALPYLGDISLRLKDPATALQYFDQAIDKFPEGKLIDDARFGRARALEALKRSDEAQQQYQSLASRKTGPRAADAQFHLGSLYFERKQFPDAINAFTTLLANFPQSGLVPASQLNIGYALYQSGRFAEAADQFETAAKERGQSLTGRYWQARSLKAAGEYAKAAALLQTVSRAAEKSPMLEAVLFEQALCERYLQHPAEAKQYFQAVIDRFPAGDLADDSLHALIEMEIEAGDFTSASQRLVQFQRDYPQSGLRWHIEMLNGRLELSKAGALQRDQPLSPEVKTLYQAAAARFEQILKESTIAKTRNQARYYFALTRQLQGQSEQALELISPLAEQVIADAGKSDFVDALILQADCYLQLQKNAAAEAAAVKYLELAPTGRQVARSLSIQALAADQRSDKAGVTAAVNRLVTEFGTQAATLTTLQQLAESAESREDWPEAGKLYSSLANLQKDPEKRAYALRGVAQSQYSQNQFVTAASTFGQVVAEEPEHRLVPECLYFQADSLRKIERTDEALAIFRKLFETFPADKKAEPKSELQPPLEYPYKAGLQVARILNRAKQVVESDAAYEALLTRFPQPAELDKRLDEWAILNYQHERYDRADAIWRRLIAETPNSPLANSARLSLAESDLIANRLDDAEQAFELLSRSEHSSNEVKERALYQLIVLAMERQRWMDVLEISNRLLNQFPNTKHQSYAAYSQAEAYLANSKSTEQDLLAARERLTKLIADSATNTELNDEPWLDRVWVLLAELGFREKKYAEVGAVVADLRKRNEKSAFLHQAEEILGRTYKQQAPPRFAEARAAFERVLADPQAARTETAAKAQFMIGETYFHQEKWEEASLAYQRVYGIYRFPEWQAAALLMSGRCDEAQNDWKGAAESYKLLLREFPESSVAGDATTRLANAQQKIGS